jgi:hypothetical protein
MLINASSWPPLANYFNGVLDGGSDLEPVRTRRGDAARWTGRQGSAWRRSIGKARAPMQKPGPRWIDEIRSAKRYVLDGGRG